MNCGEGWPNFIANKIVEKGTFCFGDWTDAIFKFLYPDPVCKSIKDWGFRNGDDGLPLTDECTKNSFFQYYLTPESMTLFRALYENNFGF
jgi:hypothetical protein